MPNDKTYRVTLAVDITAANNADAVERAASLSVLDNNGTAEWIGADVVSIEDESFNEI